MNDLKEKENLVKVMIVDDSKVVVSLLERILNESFLIKVVEKAHNGQEAIEKLKYNKDEIDLILLDIQMPILDGIDTIPKILSIKPEIKILVVSSLAQNGSFYTVKALSLGAADYIEKPKSHEEIDKFTNNLLIKIKMLFSKRSKNEITLERNTEPNKYINLAVPKHEVVSPEVIAVACSTGGPRALMEVFGGLSNKFLSENIIVVTQHIKNDFISLLVDNLNSLDKINCKIAEEGEQLIPGTIYLAGGNCHLELQKKGSKIFAHLNDGPPENFCRPSADPMFRSIAKAGINAIGLVLTGIGNDGQKGATEMYEKGNVVIAQDKDTSVVWGMPGAVAKAGICSAILPLHKIAYYLERGF